MNIDSLKASLEAGAALPPPPVAALKIEAVDTSSWKGFDGFFDKPEAKSLIYQSGAPLNLVVPCSFFSVVNSDRQKAIDLLRKDLLHLRNLCSGIPGVGEGFDVVAFLAKPSTIELVVPTKEGEPSDTTTYVDLRGPVPAKKKWAAFCFLFAYKDGMWFNDSFSYRTINVQDWKGLGLPSAVQEGEVGRDTDEFLASVGEQLGPVVEAELAEPEEPELAPQKIVETPIAPMTELAATGDKTVAETVGILHPEIAAAAEKYGIDLKAKPGRELEEMRKYFGQGSGLYLVTVDFQVARTEAHKLDERAQKKILKALKPAKRRRPAKKVVKAKTKKRALRKPVRRGASGRR